MKINTIKTATKTFAFAALIAGGLTTSRADITTGWLQTAAGTYDFLSSDNWADGEVNGVFSSDWTSGGAQTIELSDDWTGTIDVYGGVGHNIAINGTGGTRTIHLNGDMHWQATSMDSSSSQFIIGNAIVLDLGGVVRNLYVGQTKIAGWMLQGTVQNGTLAIDGTGTVSLRNADAEVLCDVALSGGATYRTAYTSGLSSNVSRTRGANVAASRSTLYFSASQVSASDTIQGQLRILSDEPSCSFLRLAVAKSGIYQALNIGSLSIDDGGMLVVRGSAKLGAGTPGTSDTATLKFDSAPSLVGGIIPRVVATSESSGDTDSATFTSYNATFAAYSSENGVKALSSTDFVSSSAESLASTDNVLVSAGTKLSISENTKVNSLMLESTGYNVAPGTLSGDGTLSIASGMIIAKPYKDYGKSGTDPMINAPLDFGSVQGYVVNAGGAGYKVRIGKPMSGTAGVVFTHLAGTSQDFKVVSTTSIGSFAIENMAADSTYTGDTYIQGVLCANGYSFMPNGTRSGNVYLNGTLECSSSSAADITINGLYGNGLVYGRNGTLTVGDNDADGDFSGSVSSSGSNTVLANLNKIGTGTQRLSGNVMLGSSLNVNAGAVVIDGSVAQGAVNVAANAALGGNGGITNSVAFADGAKFVVNVADDVASCLDVAGEVTGGTVTATANVTSGKWRTPQCILRSDAEITATFVRGEGIGALELKNNNTELWASPKVPGLTIVFR